MDAKSALANNPHLDLSERSGSLIPITQGQPDQSDLIRSKSIAEGVKRTSDLNGQFADSACGSAPVADNAKVFVSGGDKGKGVKGGDGYSGAVMPPTDRPSTLATSGGDNKGKGVKGGAGAPSIGRPASPSMAPVPAAPTAPAAPPAGDDCVLPTYGAPGYGALHQQYLACMQHMMNNSPRSRRRSE